jgi:hypothetical protein
MRIVIRDGLVQVDDRAFSVLETILRGLLDGEIVVDKTRGIRGEFELQGSAEYSYVSPGLLIVSSEVCSTLSSRLEIADSRRSILVKMRDVRLEKPEVSVKLSRVQATLAISFKPRRVVVDCSNCELKVLETPFQLLVEARGLFQSS